MKKPKQILFKLVALGTIHGINIEQHQTGTATADTFCVITGKTWDKVNEKSIKTVYKGKWKNVKDYIKLSPDNNSIAKIYNEYFKEYKQWINYEHENKKELEEYERLKAKFG